MKTPTIESCGTQQCLSRTIKTLLDIGRASDSPYEEFQSPEIVRAVRAIFPKYYGDFCIMLLNKYLPEFKKKDIMIMGQFFMALNEVGLTPEGFVKKDTNAYYKIGELQYKAGVCSSWCKDVRTTQGWGYVLTNDIMLQILSSRL